MKKIILVPFVLLLIFLAFGCAKKTTENKVDTTALTNTTITVTADKVTPEVPKDKETCEAKNGIWGKVGLGPVEQCNLKTTDGGKACKDSDECESRCLGKVNSLASESVQKQMGSEATGECSYVQIIVGCRAFIEDGKVDQILCLD